MHDASGRQGADGADGAATAAKFSDFGSQRVTATSGRQPGVETAPGAHAIYRACTLRSGVDAARIRGWLTLLTDDITRLMSGRPVLADVEPELGAEPSSLTVTVGFGPRFVAAVGASVPSWLAPLPAYKIDRLQKRWGQADLLLQITCDDPLTLAHADRVLQRECAPFGTVAWVQEGFRYARGSRPDGTTMRNMFGQVDGTTNPKPGTADFDSVVWRTGSDAFGDASTTLVLRRIAMDLDTWDEVDRSAREDAVGRRLRDGAPITGGSEHTEPDFDAKHGLVTKVADFAHVRRARTGDASQRIYRRGYNYASPGVAGSSSDRAGLLFAAFQADPVAQFHPIQTRLAELDMMNEWTHPVGSAVFWIPPAASSGGFIGEGLYR
jgi:dye decolorizing peroxidase